MFSMLYQNILIVTLVQFFLVTTEVTGMIDLNALDALKLPINQLPKEISQSDERDQTEQSSDDDCEGDCNVECSICLNNFSINETLGVLSKCHHGFHFSCIMANMAFGNKQCPLCRQESSSVRLIILTKATRETPSYLVQAEQIFIEFLVKLGQWTQPLLTYFNALPPKKKVFYTLMSALGIALVGYLAYQYLMSGNGVNANDAIKDCACSYHQS